MFVREDNPQALASGLSPVQTQNHIITCLLHCMYCEIFDVKTFKYQRKVLVYSLCVCTGR